VDLSGVAFNKVKAGIANSLWLASNVPAWQRFRRALRNPGEVQLQLLRQYLAKNADTAWGKAHYFREIRNYGEFTRRIPLRSYDDLEPWIARIKRGEKRVLTADRVTHLIPTSGSSGARKLIPFTADLQREFNAGIGPWIVDLYRPYPSLTAGTAYWSVSPALEAVESDSSVIPVGFDADSTYLGGARKFLVDSVMAVPSEVRFVPDLDQFRYVTLLCLLRQSDLRLISVWHPSFLSLLLDALPAHWKNLLDDIRLGRCRYSAALAPQVLHALKLSPRPARARYLASSDPLRPESLWPQLKVISCWGDANAELAIADLQRRFPTVFIQPKGLLATEAFVTIPFSNSLPLAVCSHFFEFIDEQGAVHLAGELRENEIYEVVVTTAGGLCRYRLQDQVLVTGFVEKTPAFRFLGRKGKVSDRFGEKLSEPFVAAVLKELTADFQKQARFAMLAPDEHSSGCCYTLYIEGDIRADLATLLDTLLRQNPHYDWCRKLGQLGTPRLFRVKTQAYEAYVAREMSSGKRLGDIKPSSLSLQPGWTNYFNGTYLGSQYGADYRLPLGLESSQC